MKILWILLAWLVAIGLYMGFNYCCHANDDNLEDYIENNKK